MGGETMLLESELSESDILAYYDELFSDWEASPRGSAIQNYKQGDQLFIVLIVPSVDDVDGDVIVVSCERE